MNTNDSTNKRTPAKNESSGLIRMSDVTPKAVEWLWFPFIPKNKITLIRGDGERGRPAFALP